MSKDKNQITVGINREIIDTETDSSAEFHVIRHMSLDYATGFNVVSLDSYVRKSTFERRGRSVGSMQLNIPGVPPRGTDVLDWAYQAVVAAVEGGAVDAYGQPISANSLTGAELVYADLPEAAI